MATPALHQATSAARDFVRAAGEGDLGSLEELLAAGADVNAAADYGETALIAAAAKGHTRVVQWLLEAGARPDARRGDGFNALISAVIFGHEGAVRALLAHGADVLAKDGTGTTPHRWALSKGWIELAHLLKEAEGSPPSSRPAARETSAPAAPSSFAAPVFRAGEARAASDARAEEPSAATVIRPRTPDPARSTWPSDGAPRWRRRRNLPGAASAGVQAVLRRAEHYVNSASPRRLAALALVSSISTGAIVFVAGLIISPARPQMPVAPTAETKNHRAADPLRPALPQPAPASADRTEPVTKPAAVPGPVTAPAPALTINSAPAPAPVSDPPASRATQPTRAQLQPRLLTTEGEASADEDGASASQAQTARPAAARQPQAPPPPPIVLEAGGEAGKAAAAPRASRPQPRVSEPTATPAQLPPPSAAPAKKVIRWP